MWAKLLQQNPPVLNCGATNTGDPYNGQKQLCVVMERK